MNKYIYSNNNLGLYASARTQKTINIAPPILLNNYGSCVTELPNFFERCGAPCPKSTSEWKTGYLYLVSYLSLEESYFHCWNWFWWLNLVHMRRPIITSPYITQLNLLYFRSSILMASLRWLYENSYTWCLVLYGLSKWKRLKLMWCNENLRILVNDVIKFEKVGLFSLYWYIGHPNFSYVIYKI